MLQVAEAAYRFFRELLPSRRKAKYGDLDYDFDHMVDTTRSNVGFRAQLTAALSGAPLFPTEPWLFEQIMQALASIRFSEEFTFIDLGSGKGRVLADGSADMDSRELSAWSSCRSGTALREENIRKFTDVNTGSLHP